MRVIAADGVALSPRRITASINAPMTMMTMTVEVQNSTDHSVWIAREAVAAGSSTVCAPGDIV